MSATRASISMTVTTSLAAISNTRDSPCEFAQRDQAFWFRVCGVAPEAGDEQVRAVGGYVLDSDGRHQAISGWAAARASSAAAMRSAQAAEQLARTRARVSAMRPGADVGSQAKRSATRAAHSPKRARVREGGSKRDDVHVRRSRVDVGVVDGRLSAACMLPMPSQKTASAWTITRQRFRVRSGRANAHGCGRADAQWRCGCVGDVGVASWRARSSCATMARAITRSLPGSRTGLC